ncbi:MAG: DUF559 domain-containing protein [Egibacteraceae bacterium]
MHPLAQIHRDAAACGYVDARAAGLPDGLHPRTLARHLRRIGWKPWMPGFWVPGVADDGEPPYLVRCRIVLAVLGPQALLTGASALWALDILRSQPDDVELLLPEARWLAPRPGVCIHYTADHDSIRSLSAQSLRISWVARAIADHASHAGVSPLCRVIADAERLRHTTLTQVGEEISRRPRFPGRLALRRAHAELSGELNHSSNERLARQLLRPAGVAVPARPGPIVHRERTVAEVDLPFFDVRYGVEIDGPPHLRVAQARRDTARDRMLRRDCGWTIDRFWWFELEEDPARFTREVVARLRTLGSTAVAAPGPPDEVVTGG